jgi:hypothetical protein
LSETVLVRYFVHDVDVALGFHTGLLGFAEVMPPAPTFAMATRASTSATTS